MPFLLSIRSTVLPLGALASLGALTGCYTQLASRGYGAMQAPAYAAPADSAAGDTALAERPADSRGAPPVIVNHYYHPELAYRGYAHWEWDYPALTLGYYSSHYSHFSRPYWWDDPYYSRRHAYRHSHHPHPQPHRDRDYRPAPGGGGSAAPRLMNPETDYPRPRKRRRFEPAPVSAPPPSPSPSPKQSEDGGPSSSGSSASPSSGGESQSGSSSSPDQNRDYPRLKKGKRR